jgi:hypothetical protein
MDDRQEIAKRFSAWASSEEGKKRIYEDAKKARLFIQDFRNARNVSQEILDRRITI